MWRKRIKPPDEGERVIEDVEKAREQTMNRAVKLLAAKPRSVTELRERLLEKNWTNAEIVDRVIAKLREYGYLDDDKYASDLALSKLRQKPQGRRRLQHSMSQKKLDREIVKNALESAFEKMPEAALINILIEKRLRIKGRPNTFEEKKKFVDHLLRQGFDYDLIREKMASLSLPPE